MNTTRSLAEHLVRLPAHPIRVQLVGRLADDLGAAVRGAALDPADQRALDCSLQQVMNGWSLSVSRFLRVQDDVEGVLRRGQVAAPLVDAVLADLEEVFLALWGRAADWKALSSDDSVTAALLLHN